MLKINCGLSRKVSKDYNSTGFSVNLEAEITAPVSDPEAVIEQVKEVFDLAESALDAQIERSQSTSANSRTTIFTTMLRGTRFWALAAKKRKGASKPQPLPAPRPAPTSGTTCAN